MAFQFFITSRSSTNHICQQMLHAKYVTGVQLIRPVTPLVNLQHTKIKVTMVFTMSYLLQLTSLPYLANELKVEWKDSTCV